MKPVSFPEETVIIAKDQPEYLPLPAHCFANDPHGRIACCWKLTWRERFRLLITGRIWHEILTFNKPLQPQLLMVEKPDMPTSARKCDICGSTGIFWAEDEDNRIWCARCMDKWEKKHNADWGSGKPLT